MKNKLVILLFTFFVISTTIAQTDNSVMQTTKAIKLKESFDASSKNDSVNFDFSDEELKKALSGKYQGIIEISMCCEDFYYPFGSVYFDLTTEPILFIYGGVDLSSYYSYKNGKILLSESNTLQGWFEKLNDTWVYWQIFYGYEDDYITDRKPSYLTKNADLESSKAEIKSYLDLDNEFKAYWNKFKNALINSDADALSKLINFPLNDRTSYRENKKLSKTIVDSKEFLKRVRLYLNQVKTTPERYFEAASCYKVMEGIEYLGGLYHHGGMFNLIFDKLNEEFKLVELFGPAG